MSKLEGDNAKNKKINTINFNDFIDNDLRVAIELAKDTKINSIEDIKALTGYLDLSMMNTGINLTSLRGLEFAINIEQLYLTETGISNINEISSLNNLKWLEVNNNNITDINPVANLINLQETLPLRRLSMEPPQPEAPCGLPTRSPTDPGIARRSSAHRFLDKRGDLGLVGDGQLLQREGVRPLVPSSRFAWS